MRSYIDPHIFNLFLVNFLLFSFLETNIQTILHKNRTEVLEKILAHCREVNLLVNLAEYNSPASFCLFKVKIGNTWKMKIVNTWKICLKLTLKTPERCQWLAFIWTDFTHFTGVSVVDFEQVNDGWVWIIRDRSFNEKYSRHINTSQLICQKNQLNGFYMRERLVVDGSDFTFIAIWLAIRISSYMSTLPMIRLWRLSQFQKSKPKLCMK